MQKHSKQSNVSIRRFLCVSMLIVGISIFSSISLNATTVSYDPPTYSSLTPHDPISITSDSLLEVFPGTGTAEDPYIIENYNITTTDNNGVYITGTTKYFTIRNCYVDANNYGIYIYNVADGTASVINNTCRNNFYYGLYLLYSIGSTVANNTCENNNNYGIYLEDSGSSTVENNTFTNCGLYLREYSIDAYLSYTVKDNLVNGKKLGFYTNLDSTIIAETIYGQLILINCTNVTVRNQIIYHATTAIFLYSCTSSIIINNTCENNWESIWLDHSDISTVSNNTCNNNGYGITLWYSGSSTVANNTCNDNDWGGVSVAFSGGSTVTNNTCENNYEGIPLHASDSSTVAKNTCNNNNYGISLGFSGSSTVTNNTCSNNNWDGIYLSYSSSCVITYNLLQENEGYGIHLVYSDNNLIHHNIFVDNNLGGTSQAFDDGANNYWYDSAEQEGNYWSDWSGSGNYSIDGSAGAVDLYPLGEPVITTIAEYKLPFTFTLLIFIVPCLLIVMLFRKDNRKIKR